MPPIFTCSLCQVCPHWKASSRVSISFNLSFFGHCTHLEYSSGGHSVKCNEASVRKWNKYGHLSVLNNYVSLVNVAILWAFLIRAIFSSTHRSGSSSGCWCRRSGRASGTPSRSWGSCPKRRRSQRLPSRTRQSSGRSRRSSSWPNHFYHWTKSLNPSEIFRRSPNPTEILRMHPKCTCYRLLLKLFNMWQLSSKI